MDFGLALDLYQLLAQFEVSISDRRPDPGLDTRKLGCNFVKPRIRFMCIAQFFRLLCIAFSNGCHVTMYRVSIKPDRMPPRPVTAAQSASAQVANRC